MRLQVIRRLRWGGHHLKCQLTHAHARVERNRKTVEVTDFQCNRSDETRIHETGRGMDDDTEPSERTSAFYPHYKIIRHRDFLLCHTKNELPRLHDERLTVRNGDDTHVLREGFGVFRVQNCVLAVFVDLEDVAEPKIHAGSVDVLKQLRLVGLDFDTSGFDGLLNISVRENHNEGVSGCRDYHTQATRENRKNATEFRASRDRFVVYSLSPMSLETLSMQRQETTETNPSLLRLQREQIMDQYRAYFQETFKEKKVAGAQETAATEQWVRTQKATEEGVTSLRDFYTGFLKNNLASGRSLHNRFHSDISRAAQNRWISRESQQKWVHRFEDPSASYKDREKWVTEEMPQMLERWKTTAEDRKKLAANDDFKILVGKKPEFGDILSEEKFLNLHYDKRRSLVAAARASMLALEKGQDGMYDEAKHKLQWAVSVGIMHSGKVGIWLERIFSSSANPKKIDAFLNGSSGTSLNALIKNWTAVSRRFDNVEKKFKERWEGTGIRGFHPVSKTKFLSMHYAQRLQYVGQAEDRLDAANDVENDAPILLKIRHEMDTEDWESAAKLIAQAKTESLSESNFTRLKSMEGYVKQFRKTQETKEQSASISELEQRINAVMEDIGAHQSEVQPMAERLMRGPRADMNIHQWRWLVYNHVWCTTHGYLNQDIARKGGSKENEERTRLCSKNGDDTGRNNVVGATTSHMQAIRKREYANHSATFHHVDVTNADSNNTTAEWLERDQDPKDLYWRTYIAKDKDGPKSDNWHRDLFANLTELRSLARTMRRAGYIYTGSVGGLVNVN